MQLILESREAVLCSNLEIISSGDIVNANITLSDGAISFKNFSHELFVLISIFKSVCLSAKSTHLFVYPKIFSTASKSVSYDTQRYTGCFCSNLYTSSKMSSKLTNSTTFPDGYMPLR